MSVPFKPTRGRILVEKVAPEEKTAGGLFIPQQSQVEDNKVKVVRVGEGVNLLEGMIVSYRFEAGRPMTIQGKEYLLMYENDIDGIYE